MWCPGMYMKMALVPKGIRAIHLSYGAGDGKSKVCFANPCFAAGRWPLRAALENAHAFSQLRTLPVRFPSPGTLMKTLWHQIEPKPLKLSYGAGDGNRTRVISLEAGVLPLNYARKIWSGRQD